MHDDDHEHMSNPFCECTCGECIADAGRDAYCICQECNGNCSAPHSPMLKGW